MNRYVVHRLVHLVPVLIAVSFLVFLILHLVPGDPAVVVAGLGATAEDIARIRTQLGLDDPVFVQYWRWISRVVAGDWGRSIVSGQPVLPLIWDRFQNTVTLAALGIFLAFTVGLPLGVVAALRRNSIWDFGATVVALLGISAPVYWIGLILQLYFAVVLGWLPATGSGTWAHYILPAVVIGANSTGIIMRMTRASVLEVLNQDYVRTARAKGCSQGSIVFKHVLRNALVTIVTVVGLQFAYLLGGAVLTETVFNWPGLGRLLVDSIFRRDFPMVQGSILMIGTGFVIVNLLTDLAYAWIDPRIRYN